MPPESSAQTIVKIPVITSIPIGKILPNPNQPRKFINPLALEKLKASLRAKGQKTPAKVRPLTGAERLLYPGFEFMLLGGHRRREAALALGFDSLIALVVDLTPEEAELEAVLDNSWEDMFWLDWDLAVESLYGDGKKRLPDGSKLTQEVLADQLGASQSKVSYALRVAGALTQAARGKIYETLIKSGDESRVKEAPILALTALGDPALVEKALPVVLDRQLTEEKAKKLVEFVKKGGQPEEFGLKDPKEAPEDPLAAYWPQLGPGFKVKYKGGETYQVQMTLQGGKETWNAAIAASRALKGAGGGEPAHLPPGPAGADGGATAPAGRSLGEGGPDTPGPTSQGQTGSPLPTFHDLGRSWAQAVGMGEPFPAKGRFGALLAWWFGFFGRNLGWAWKNLPGPLKTEFRLLVRHGFHAVRNPVQFGKGVKGGMGRFLRPVYSAVIQTALRNPTRVLAWGLILVLVWTGYRAAIWGIRGAGWRLLHSQTRLVVPGQGGGGKGSVQRDSGVTEFMAVPTHSPQRQAQRPVTLRKAMPKAEIVPDQGVNPVVSAPVTAHLSTDPQVGGNGLVGPSLGAGGNGGTQMGSATPKPQGSSLGNQLVNYAGQSHGATPAPTKKPQGGDLFGNFLGNVANGAVSGLAGSASNAASNVTSNAVQGIIGH